MSTCSVPRVVAGVVMKLFVLLLFSAVLGGCSTLLTFPEPRSEGQRLSDFPTKDWPVKGKVSIYWHQNMIPFIEAENDLDCAFAIGVVQAHLRLGQLEMFRRLSAGRLSESGGAFSTSPGRPPHQNH
ncbi:MAG: penicillin acylase family protein [Pseudobacteriovorax sp.]|nr:penicillin acylase family protein [Pseudobacteriovorax sp.]